jgi:hypothetical protein
MKMNYFLLIIHIYRMNIPIVAKLPVLFVDFCCRHIDFSIEIPSGCDKN